MWLHSYAITVVLWVESHRYLTSESLGCFIRRRRRCQVCTVRTSFIRCWRRFWKKHVYFLQWLRCSIATLISAFCWITWQLCKHPDDLHSRIDEHKQKKSDLSLLH